MNDKKPSPEMHKALQSKKVPPKSESPEHKEPEKEIAGFKDSGLLEPTRFGDWEVKGRCSDF